MAELKYESSSKLTSGLSRCVSVDLSHMALSTRFELWAFFGPESYQTYSSACKTYFTQFPLKKRLLEMKTYIRVHFITFSLARAI